MDRLQRYNQRLLRNALREPRLLVSLDVTAGRRIRATSVTWEEYWGQCDALARKVAELKAAWTALVTKNLSSSLRRDFVRTYSLLLKACLDRCARDQEVLLLLRKIVGLEVIRVSGDCGGVAAAIVRARHPVYLLSKLANPRGPENPKYLPLVCPYATAPDANALYWHYRRIPLVRTNRIQLFVYPPAQVGNRPLSHALIGQLFGCLTPRTDPRVRERSQSLFDGVFASVAGTTSSRESSPTPALNRLGPHQD